MKFENTHVSGFEAAVRGMRNPLNSWDKSDSIFCLNSEDWVYLDVEEVAKSYPEIYHNPESAGFDLTEFLNYNGVGGALGESGEVKVEALLGYKDLTLAKNLTLAGSSDGKFLRQINVSVDITAPSYWLAELDTYKIATTRNSTSLQHKGMSRDYTIEDFTLDNDIQANQDLQVILDMVNKYRQLYKETKDYTYFRIMRQLMPMGYNYRITWTSNYAGLRNMYHQRKNHALVEWRKDFCEWCEGLPYGKDLIASQLEK